MNSKQSTVRITNKNSKRECKGSTEVDHPAPEEHARRNRRGAGYSDGVAKPRETRMMEWHLWRSQQRQSQQEKSGSTPHRSRWRLRRALYEHGLTIASAIFGTSLASALALGSSASAVLLLCVGVLVAVSATSLVWSLSRFL